MIFVFVRRHVSMCSTFGKRILPLTKSRPPVPYVDSTVTVVKLALTTEVATVHGSRRTERLTDGHQS